MDDNLYIPDIYPVNFSKTITLKVSNIEMHDDPRGYSFEVECNGTIIKFDQFMSTSPVFGPKAIMNASVGLARYRRIVYPSPFVTGDQQLEYFIIDAYRELMAVTGKSCQRVNIVVKWPEKEMA